MPTPNPFPLGISNKQDTWEKLQLMAGVNEELKVPAAEINKIIQALNFLYGDGAYIGNVPIKVKYVSVDYTTPGSILSKVAAAVEALPNYVMDKGTVYYFFTIRTMLTNGSGVSTTPGGPAFAIIKEHFAFTKKLIPDGSGIISVGVGGTPVFETDFYPSFIIDTREFAPIEFDLGDIAATAINTAVDTSGPYSTPNITTVIFSATQSGVAKSWIYIGSAEEIGTGFPVTALSDFRELDPNNVDPPPTNYIYPIYTPDTGTEILIQSRLGNYCNMETPSTEDVFKLIWSDTGTSELLPPFATWARVLWNSAGKAAYPGIEGEWFITLTGTNGTATVSIGANDYLATFGDDLNDTAADFITSHAANILAATGLVATNPGGSNIRLVGVNTDAVSIATTTGDLNGTIEALTPILIDSPDFQAGVLYDMFVVCDGHQVNYSFRKRNLGSASPIDIEPDDHFADITALIADQNNQLEGEILYVADASAHPDIGAGYAYLEYLGTIVGDTTDYRIIAKEEAEFLTSPTTINMSDYATPDGISKGDGATTSGSANFTSATGEFTLSDEGKTIFIGDGAGGSSLPLVTTILTYISATQVTLATNAGATVSSAYYMYGTDSTSGIQNALDAAFVIGQTYGKATLQCESGNYIIAGAVGSAGNGENAQIKWPYYNITNEVVNIELLGDTKASIPRIYWQENTKHGTVFFSTIINHAFSAATGLPSIIGSLSSYGVKHGTGWDLNYVGMAIGDITFRQADNPYLTGIDAGWVHNINFKRLQFDTVKTQLAATVPSHPTSVGVQFPIVNCRGPVVANNITVKGYYCAFGLGELLNGSRLEGLLCNMLVALTPTYHANNIDFLEDINCIHGFGGLNPATGIIDPTTTLSWLPHAVNLGTGLYITLWTIQDNNSQVAGFNRIEHVKDINSVSKIVGYYTLVNAGGTRVLDGLIYTGVKPPILDLFLQTTIDPLSPPIFLNASNFDALSGSPLKSIQNEVPVYLFDASAFESIVSSVQMPSDWDGYAITLYWTNNGAGSGNVVWQHKYKGLTNNESFTVVAESGTPKTEAAPVQGTLKTTLLQGGVSLLGTIQSIQVVRIASDAGDTLANDVSFIGVMLSSDDASIPIGNILSYWNVDANSLDQVGANDGTDTLMSYVASGGIGNVADFTAGTTSKIDVGDPANLSFGNGTVDSPFSISLRVKFSTIGAINVLLDKRLSDNTNKEYTMFYETSPSNRLVFRMFDQSTGGTRDIIYVGTLATATWYSIIVAYDGTTGSIFINAVETAGVTDTGSYTAMENGTGTLIFGKDNRYTTASLNGYLDEKAFFNKALNISEATAIYDKNQAGLYLTE